MFYFFNEETLSKEDRENLKDHQFGLPEKREYPLNDLPHILQAIRMFRNCNNNDKKELANNIINALQDHQYLDIYIDNNKNSEFIKFCNSKKLLKFSLSKISELKKLIIDFSLLPK